MMTEEQYLKRTLDLIAQKQAALKERLGDSQKRIDEIRTYYWENYTEFDEYGYEMYDNTSAIVRISDERSELIRRQYALERMADSPYFARIDFCFDGEDESESFYIGLFHLAESAKTGALVYDWRAPISGLFYDYDQGPASYEAPAGTIYGEITDKVQYKIKRGKLIYAVHSEINIDDDILKMELANHADHRLKSIVTTIQKEQNAIIRDTKHPIMIVQGCAGSGKTSVAMHRIAYLLYHNRSGLKASQVLVLSPNDIFSDYISRILPELGEQNIKQMELDVFAWHQLLSIGESEDRYDALERELNVPGDGCESFVKQTEEYVRELDGYLLELESTLVDIKDVSLFGRVIKADWISGLFYEKLWDVPLLKRMERIAEFVIDEEETVRNKELDEEVKEYVLSVLNGLYETSDLLELYNRFLEESGRERIPEPVSTIPYEDVYPLLYLKISLNGMKNKRPVKHLIIDEMQDYSYLQYRILLKLFDCPMTILGDEEQVLTDQKSGVLSFLPKLLGKTAYTIRLDKSYRSTEQITRYAAALKGTHRINSVGRQGTDPKEIKTGSSDEMIETMIRELDEGRSERETVGILCLNQNMADQVYDGLSKRLGDSVHLLNKHSHKFDTGICVTTYYLAKGLEFDAVLVPHLEAYQSKLHQQALYIIATRALHELYLYRIDSDMNDIK